MKINQEKQKPRESGKTILVIEDDHTLNDLICAELEDAGYTVLSAHDGDAGLKAARENIPDLVLLDVMLPDTTGIEISNSFQNDDTLKSIPIIMVTSRYDLSTKMASFVSGARKYVTKPFETENLLQEIGKLLNRFSE